MIPEPDQYLSFLMGAPAISDEEINRLGVKVVERFGAGIRGLLIPSVALQAYKDLVREKLSPGFWNDIVGRRQILFLFKLGDGTVKEIVYSRENRGEIARLCTEFNKDPIEKTSDIPRYLSGNPFYRDLIIKFHQSPSIN